MKKTTKIKILSGIVQGIPPLVVLILNHKIFIEQTEKTLSLGAMFVIVILGFIFKDFVKDLYKTPSAFKVSLIVFLISFIGVTLGQQMLQLSGSVLIGSGLSAPFTIWENNIKNNSSDQILETLKGMVNKDEIK